MSYNHINGAFDRENNVPDSSSANAPVSLAPMGEPLPPLNPEQPTGIDGELPGATARGLNRGDRFVRSCWMVNGYKFNGMRPSMVVRHGIVGFGLAWAGYHVYKLAIERIYHYWFVPAAMNFWDFLEDEWNEAEKDRPAMLKYYQRHYVDLDWNGRQSNETLPPRTDQF